jgi:phosphoribosylanthranilate isomerase
MRISAKICGIKDAVALDAAMSGGARWVGFVFYPPSPRHVTPERAAPLAQHAAGRVAQVGMFVDPSDADVEMTLDKVKLDFLQLHGCETPQRVAVLKERFNLPVMKAIGVASESDIAAAEAYEPIADWLLFDAKPSGGALPGGSGAAFDWRLLSGRNFRRPWLLSGGLDAENVQEAISTTGAPAVDVSSGVESARGIKDPGRIAQFLKALNG